MQRLFFLFILSLSFIPNSLAASFDCSKAIRPQDRLICTTSALSAADDQLAAVYKNALTAADDPIALKKSQQLWLKNTQDRCGNTENCLFDAYQTRIIELQKIAGVISNIPSTASVTNARNIDGTYPIWISPELGLKSLSTQDINAALKRKFWDSPAIFQLDHAEEINELKAHKTDEGMPTSCNEIDQLMHDQKIVNDSRHNCAFLYPASNLSKSDPARYYPYGYLMQPWIYCQAIKLLKQLKPAKESTVHDVSLTQELPSIMPALLVPDNVPFIEDIDKVNKNPLLKIKNQKMNWQIYYPWLKDRLYFLNIEPTHATMRFKDTNFDRIYAKTDLIILARGDFINDGTEQLLVSNSVYKYSTDLAGDGSSIALYLLRRDKKSKILEVLYPENYLFSQCNLWLSNIVNK